MISAVYQNQCGPDLDIIQCIHEYYMVLHHAQFFICMFQLKLMKIEIK